MHFPVTRGLNVKAQWNSNRKRPVCCLISHANVYSPASFLIWPLPSRALPSLPPQHLVSRGVALPLVPCAVCLRYRNISRWWPSQKKFCSNRFQDEKEERPGGFLNLSAELCHWSLLPVWLVCGWWWKILQMLLPFFGRHILCLQSWRAQIRSGGRVWRQ